jgi:hypothetical protein
MGAEPQTAAAPPRLNPALELRLSRFIDRETEMRDFCRMLDEPRWPRPVWFVSGGGGMGKSSLLLRMMHECSSRTLPTAEIIWTETRNHDYLGVMRKIRDDIGAPKFQEFTKLVNFFTDPQTPQRVEIVVEAKGAINVAQNATVAGNGQVGTIAGVVVRDLMLTVPRSDLGIPENERMARLTDQFIAELAAAAEVSRIVVFFDAVEKATDPTHRWIWGELFGALRDGRLLNVNFVVGGRSVPPIDEAFLPLVEQRALAPLSREHIIEYLIRREIDPGEGARQQVADFVLALSGGNPLKVANAVETVIRMRAQEPLQ